MAEYIEREQALDVINLADFAFDDKNKLLLYADSVQACLLDIPSADVKPVIHGHWKEAMLDHEAFGVRPTVLYCSECHMCAPYRTNYCPNCGARMDEDENIR